MGTSLWDILHKDNTVLRVSYRQDTTAAVVWFPSRSNANTQSLASLLWHPQCGSVPLMYSAYLTMLSPWDRVGTSSAHFL